MHGGENIKKTTCPLLLRLNQIWPEPSGLRHFGSCYPNDWSCAFVSEKLA